MLVAGWELKGSRRGRGGVNHRDTVATESCLLFGIWCLEFGAWNLVGGRWSLVAVDWGLGFSRGRGGVNHRGHGGGTESTEDFLLFIVWNLVFGIWCLEFGRWSVVFG